MNHWAYSAIDAESRAPPVQRQKLNGRRFGTQPASGNFCIHRIAPASIGTTYASSRTAGAGNGSAGLTVLRALIFFTRVSTDPVPLVKLSRTAPIQHMASRTDGSNVRRLMIAVGASEMTISMITQNVRSQFFSFRIAGRAGGTTVGAMFRPGSLLITLTGILGK